LSGKRSSVKALNVQSITKESIVASGKFWFDFSIDHWLI
jgi:hypothetical protein